MPLFNCRERRKVYDVHGWHIKANNIEHSKKNKYANNFIRTTKYNLFTFLPKNLFEQFQRLANVYFLIILILQSNPAISSLPWYNTLVPLVFVLGLTALKDAIDDFGRYRSDRRVNNRLCSVLRGGDVVEERWHNINVGDIIKLKNNQQVAADILLLSTSEYHGLCYIETAELDGETNPKGRQAIPQSSELKDTEKLREFNAVVMCEAPNNNLSKYEGTLIWNSNEYPLDNDNILLRGCVLRNTKWCYGLVIYAGHDTKVMMNSGRSIFKRTHIDRLLNYIVLGILIFLLVICMFLTIACGIWETYTGQYFQDYLPWESIVPGSSSKDRTVTEGATVISVLVFFSYIIILNTVVPISLYVSVEMFRLVNSFWINWDVNMNDKTTNTAAQARTTTLNEELGQIQYIFSDKTGTLTQNLMTFKKCSINGVIYGDIYDDIGKDSVQYKPISDFNRLKLILAMQNGNFEAVHFFYILALCHTVMAEVTDGKLEYHAESPDEKALVSAAKDFGFVFKSRTADKITIDVEYKEQEETYELLCTLAFTYERKRMSVIVKKNGKITLLCKGADSVIYERLRPDCDEAKTLCTQHLNMFAKDGLRTLCLAEKEIPENVWEHWKQKLHMARTSLRDRAAKVAALYDEIEKDLTLVGVTAVEDKLQDGVPHATANLTKAGIKIWVLTGDKQETAIDIGRSCRLLTCDKDNLFEISGEHFNDIETHIDDAISKINGKPGDFGLVIQGQSLVYALQTNLKQRFLDLCCSCKAVICCRVTPLQKALVVDFIKTNTNAVTLAIGDGANDVSMIKTANVGVGISGQEGLQAVLASDYSIAQFRFLERLLLVHGRWSYFRMSKFLRYFFYKNFAFALCHLWFGMVCGFSAQTLFDPFFISVYNVLFTSLPCLVLAAFDQDVNDSVSLCNPELYTRGLTDELFNKKVFLLGAVEGFITSCVLFFIPYGVYHIGNNEIDHQSFGVVVASILVVVVNIRCALDTSYWTGFNHFVTWGSIVLYFCFTLAIYSNMWNYGYIGSALEVYSTATFWFCLILTNVILLVPVIAYRFYYHDTKPTLSDKIRLKHRNACCGCSSDVDTTQQAHSTVPVVYSKTG